jgi:hypothetical protein
MEPEKARDWVRRERANVLGHIEPLANPVVIEWKAEVVPGGSLARYALQVEPGIVLPLMLITPDDSKGKVPVVVMLAQDGKGAFLKQRGDAVAAFLKSGVAVCLPDLRGTGETRAGTAADRTSARTSISQTNLILGQTVIGSQLRDLRTVIRWVAARDGIDDGKIAVWADSFARPNPPDTKPAVPLDASLPTGSEPGAAEVANLAGLYEPVVAVYARGGVGTPLESTYLYYPHDAVVPGMLVTVGPGPHAQPHGIDAWVDGINRPETKAPQSSLDAVKWIIEKLRAK